MSVPSHPTSPSNRRRRVAGGGRVFDVVIGRRPRCGARGGRVGTRSMRRLTSIIETLERRTMLAGSPLGVSEAAYLGGTQLRLQGTATADAIMVSRTGDG